MIFTDLYTKENCYYSGYVSYLYVTNNLEALKDPSAKEYYKIIHFESGPCHIAVNGKEYILTGAHVLYINEIDNFVIYDVPQNAATILFFKPSVINSKFNFENCNSVNTLSLSEKQDLFYLADFKHIVKLSSKIFPLDVITSAIIMQKLQLLNERLTLQNTSYWPCQCRSYLLEILFSLLRPEENEKAFCSNHMVSSFSKLTIDVICYLQSSYNQKITIDKLTQVFHTNRTTLLSDFEKSTGLSINKYLTQLRMEMATTLLRDTELTVNEICERIGFSDISYFSKSFKKEIKYTPSKYRQINSHAIY